MVIGNHIGFIARLSHVDTCVNGAAKHLGNVIGLERLTAASADTNRRHLGSDLGERRGAGNDSLSKAAEIVCFHFVDQITAMPIGTITEGIGAARMLTALHLDLAALDDLLPEIQGVILCHALHEGLENDGLGSIAKVLSDGDQARASLVDDARINGSVVTVTGKAVDLMNEHEIDRAAFEIIEEGNKGGSIV